MKTMWVGVRGEEEDERNPFAICCTQDNATESKSKKKHTRKRTKGLPARVLSCVCYGAESDMSSFSIIKSM